MADLQAAGCRAVQVDEPALREGLPLKAERQEGYLRWATSAFRFATAGTRPEVQLWTHICYSDVAPVLPALEALDADVLSVEAARSGSDVLARQLASRGYGRGVAPGLFDVHSPVVPTAAEVEGRLRAARYAGLPPERTWAVPDCGLKTRRWEEALPALRHMVQAAHALRAEAKPS